MREPQPQLHQAWAQIDGQRAPVMAWRAELIEIAARWKRYTISAMKIYRSVIEKIFAGNKGLNYSLAQTLADGRVGGTGS